MEILELIKEPIFIVASTILSILISIAANLLTPKVNGYFSKFSSSLKNKQLEKKKIYISKVASMALNNNNIINLKLDVAYTLLKSLTMIVFSLFLISVLSYISPFEYLFIFLSLGLVTYAISLFNFSQKNYKIAMLATLRAEKMANLRVELDMKYEDPNEYDAHIDPEEEMYNEYLSKWDNENL